MEEISLKEILCLFKENWKLITIITLVFMGLAAVFTIFFIDKTYSSSTTLIVGRPEGYTSESSYDNYTALNIDQKLVGTYSEIAKSKSVMKQVNSALGLDISDGTLANMIEVSTVENTELIKISVTSDDPVLASTIANRTAEKFMANIADLMKIDNLQVLDMAVVNNKPIGPNLKLNIVIGFLFGIMLSVFVVFVKEALNTSIKTVDELKKLVGGVPIIGIIPDCDELNLKGEQ